MFTGLVRERGRLLRDPEPAPSGGRWLEVCHSPELGSRLPLGASLAVAGVCLTIVEPAPLPREVSRLEMGEETLRRTTLGCLRRGDEVNLEPALALGEPLGGHWVQGHVDGTGQVLDREDHAGHSILQFELPAALAQYVVEKGSITVDGVSLTVTRADPATFGVWLIPHTLAATTLGGLRPGARVNLEVDVLAKYVERQLAARLGPPAEAP